MFSRRRLALIADTLAGGSWLARTPLLGVLASPHSV
jgi:hypothetical protein